MENTGFIFIECYRTCTNDVQHGVDDDFGDSLREVWLIGVKDKPDGERL